MLRRASYYTETLCAMLSVLILYCYYYFAIDKTKKILYPTLTLKTAAFVTCWAVKKWGNARPYIKSRKKSEGKRCKNRKKKKNLTWAPVLVWKRKNPSPFRSSLESSHKMEMKYSDKGTLVQRQRYPLLPRSMQYWPMNPWSTETFRMWRAHLLSGFSQCACGNPTWTHVSHIKAT